MILGEEIGGCTNTTQMREGSCVAGATEACGWCAGGAIEGDWTVRGAKVVNEAPSVKFDGKNITSHALNSTTHDNEASTPQASSMRHQQPTLADEFLSPSQALHHRA